VMPFQPGTPLGAPRELQLLSVVVLGHERA
jgi:hypothetical protein